MPTRTRLSGCVHAAGFSYRPILPALLLLLPAIGRSADSSASAAPAAAAPDVVQMGTYEVNDVPVDQVILPNASPANTVFGTEMPVQDTPRSVSVLSSKLIDDLNINGPLDFIEGVSGTQTLDQFGGANVVDVRGEAAEIFQNGIRRTERSDGMPLSFNAIEGFDVVKGPASVDYGAGSLVGGYVNFVTKRPDFSEFKGVVDYTYGEYGENKYQFDITGPFDGGKAAYRVSYEGEDTNTYYRNTYFHTNDLYTALSFEPSSKVHFDFNSDFHFARYVEAAGINRPTQQLIDDHIYDAGSDFVKGVLYRGNKTVITPIPTIVNRHNTLVGNGDHDDGRDLNAQFDTYIYTNPGTYWVNRDYIEYYTLQQRQYAQRYYNSVAYSINFQNRTEYHHTSATGGNEFLAGNSFQMMDTLSYQDLYNEFLNATDLTGNPANYPITTGLVGVLPVPGFPNDFATPGANYHLAAFPNTDSSTLASLSYDDGLFIQDDLHFSPQWSLLYGLREDIIADRAMDPLHPPGQASDRDHTVEGQAAGNVSLSFKPAPFSTYYATASYNQSESGGAGGSPAALSTNHLSPESFHVRDYLLEAGAKYSLLNNKLFLTTAGYHQIRHNTNVLGVVTQVNVTGAEVELTYQPNKYFYVGLGGSKMDAYNPHETSGGSTLNIYDLFVAPYGSGIGSPNNNSLPAASRRIPGISDDSGYAYATYKLPNGLGVSSNVNVTGPTQTSYVGNVEVPTQYTLNASVFYDVKQFEVRVTFDNLTNQYNWTALGGVFGNDLIMPDLPFHMEASVKYRF